MVKKEQSGWKTESRECSVCGESFGVPYHHDPEFPDGFCSKPSDKTICGPECVRADKIISALNALSAKIDSLTAAPR